MIYTLDVNLWIAFAAGLLAGGVLATLWMRARIAKLEAARQFAEESTAKLGETFQALADAALRSNQSAFLDAARNWKYRPAMKDGVAVRYLKTIAIVKQ